MMNPATTMDDDNHEVSVAERGYRQPSGGDSQQRIYQPSPPAAAASTQLRGSGSYPTIMRARTANRNKIAKRTSDSSMIITGGHHLHYHHGHHGSSGGGGGGVSSVGSCVMIAGTLIPDGSLNARSVAASKKRKLLNNKRSVYSKASRRKSLENLGLLVRNRCGTAKLQWPSEKKESDVFDLLPEGCLQVRQLIRLKSRGGGSECGDAKYNRGSGSREFYRGGGGDISKGGQRHAQLNTKCDIDADDYSLGENGNPEKSEFHGVNATASIRLKFQDRQKNEEDNGGGGTTHKTDWKNRRNISVIVRIRPKHDKELAEKSIVFRTDSKTIVFDPKEKTKDFYFQGVKQLTRTDFGRKRPNRNVSFQFDKVYGPEATNKDIFDDMLKDLTDHLMEGFSVSVLAYGATGAGKTYTMIGSNSNPGLTVLMIESLYKRIEDLANEYDCEVVCSYLEVYNETIKDLLRPEKELSIREDGKKGLIISDLSFYKPRGPQELLKLLRSGNRARTQHATDLNAESSRSHAVFEVKLCLKRKWNKRCQQKGNGGGGNRKYHGQGENMKNGEGNADVHGTSIGGVGRDNNDDDGGERDEINKVEVIKSKLVMVDLAGSERGTAATFSNNHGGAGIFVDGGVRQREGASINKSLLALASCISALADGKCHVPYRNSKLTRLLKDSLNGLCTTVMIANISPSVLTSEDTYNTLKYADRAKSIVGPVAKQKNVFMEDLIGEDCAKTQMVELQVKNVQLQEQLEEERLKRELILKELVALQRKNVEETAEPGQEDGNILEKSQMKGKGNRRKSTMIGGSTEDNLPLEQRCEVDYVVETDDDDDTEKCCFVGENVSSDVVTEDQLPPEIQQYIEIVEERARIFAEYVEFASQTRFDEWAISCKKLKTDTADFLGRLPVEDKNYVWFSKLKNEVNNNSGTFCGGGAMALPTAAAANPENYQNHKKYALKLKNLTEKLELVRRNCVENNLLPSALAGYEAPHGSTKKLRDSQKTVAIPIEQYIELKRLASEHEGNEKVDQFYQEFCHKINNQLMTSGMTLMNALKLVKSVYLQLRQVEESTISGPGGEAVGIKPVSILSPSLQQEYKELLCLIYGPGPPPAVPPNAYQDQRMATAYNNKNIRSNVDADSLLQSLSPPERLPPSPTAPQIPPQLSNFGRKSSLIIDDLANMRKLVEQPLLIQLTSLLRAEEDTEIKDPLMVEAVEDKNLADLRVTEEQLRRGDSSFSCFVTTANSAIRKSLSTSQTIYEPPQPTPVSRVRGGESSPELQLPSSHGCRWRRAATATSCLGEQDEEETCYNDEDDDVEDNDHHYLHTAPVIADNDDDSTSFLANGPFQVETSAVVTANEICSKKGMWNSSTGTTTNNGGGDSHRCNLRNPVARKNSASFEIIFDKKEEKRAGGIRKSGKVARRFNEISSTPFGPSVLSALSRQKVSEKHFDNGNESLNEDWTTVTSSGSGTTTATTTSSASTSAEMVMKVKSKCVSSSDDVEEGSVQQKKTIGNRERLVDQALIKDYQKSPYHHHLCPQIKAKTTPLLRANQMQENNDNKNCQEDGEVKEEMEQENPSGYIYQVEPAPSQSFVDVLGGSGGDGGNKRGFGKADGGGCGDEMFTTTTGKVKSCVFTQRRKMDQEKKLSASTTTIVKEIVSNKVLYTKNTSCNNIHTPNPNPLRHRGHLKQQQQASVNKLKLVGAETKPDIGCFTKHNNSRPRQQHHLQQPRSNSNTGGGGGGKGLKPLLTLAAGAEVVTSTTPLEFSMNVQGQTKNQPHQQQRQHHHKVTPVKKLIGLHSSEGSTNLRNRNPEKGVETHQDRHEKIDRHYYTLSEQQSPGLEEDVGMMMGSGGDESEWEPNSSRINMINLPSAKFSESKQRSVHSSARSTLSHQHKAPYHTNCKTFTISRESLPTANMPVIPTLLSPEHEGNKAGFTNRSIMLSPDRSTEIQWERAQQYRQHRHHRQRGNIDTTNYHSSNDENSDDNENYEENSGKYTSADDQEDDVEYASCYSAGDCN